MADKKFTVLDLLDMDLKEHNALELQCIGGRKGLNRNIDTPDINRPGLALTGFFDSFAYQRVQILGMGETAYIKKLFAEGTVNSIKEMFAYSIPCCIFTHSLMPGNDFIEIADHAQVPLLQTVLGTSEFTSRLIRILSEIFSPSMSTHGTLVEVFGLGILLLGDSGIGKSETALELIERGHRLITDDVVEIYRINGNILIGQGKNKILGHHMEIRGLGIINVTQLFGVRAIRDQKQIQLVIRLEEWNPQKTYDRIGTEEEYIELLGVKIPILEIPVRHGRHIPVIIETAALNERLKMMGYHSAREFNKNIMRWTENDHVRSIFYGQEDSI